MAAAAAATAIANSTDFCTHFVRCDSITHVPAVESRVHDVQETYGAFRRVFAHLAAQLPRRELTWEELMFHRQFLLFPRDKRLQTQNSALPSPRIRHNRPLQLKAVAEQLDGQLTAEQSCSWRVDIETVRCHESVLRGIASVLVMVPLPAHCVRVVMHERCVPRRRHGLVSNQGGHGGCSSLPSFDARDRLLRVERVDARPRCRRPDDSYALHAAWSSSRRWHSSGSLPQPLLLPT